LGYLLFPCFNIGKKGYCEHGKQEKERTTHNENNDSLFSHTMIISRISQKQKINLIYKINQHYKLIIRLKVSAYEIQFLKFNNLLKSKEDLKFYMIIKMKK
jgi:hypothetical protein